MESGSVNIYTICEYLYEVCNMWDTTSGGNTGFVKWVTNSFIYH
jgi:hypothetical protein